MDDIGQKIREIRLSKGLKLKEVAELTGLSQGFLSQVETSKSSVTLQSISKIADALEVSRAYFFENEEKPTAKIEIDKEKTESKSHFNFHNSSFVYQSLSKKLENPLFEPMLVVLMPTDEEVNASIHNGQEFVYVLEGTLTVIIEDEKVQLEKGESFHINSTTLHTWFNNTTQPVKLLYIYAKH